MNECKPKQTKASADYSADNHLIYCVVEQINAPNADKNGHEA